MNRAAQTNVAAVQFGSVLMAYFKNCKLNQSKLFSSVHGTSSYWFRTGSKMVILIYYVHLKFKILLIGEIYFMHILSSCEWLFTLIAYRQ